MRFLLDENIPGHTEDYLRSAGHEIIRAPQREKDHKILRLAESQKALILTRDRDFLTFLPSWCSGIIYVSIHPSIAEHITEALRKLLANIHEKALHGTVVILTRQGYEIFR